MKYFVYIVECSDASLYTGITTDIQRRVCEHNEGEKGAKYTKVRRPVKLVYSAEFVDRSSVSKEEYRIKQLTKLKKIELIDTNNRHCCKK